MSATVDTATNPVEAARFLHAFVECNRATQDNVLEMVAIILDPAATDDERSHAGDAIMECLFPLTTADIAADYSARLKSAEAGQARADLRREEQNFADNLRVRMAERGVTQEMLAQKAGIGQPAVSNILNRHCRPQRKTVVKFAEALGVAPGELWPGFAETCG